MTAFDPFDLLLPVEPTVSASPEDDPYERHLLRALVLAYINVHRERGSFSVDDDFRTWYTDNAKRLGLAIPPIDAIVNAAKAAGNKGRSSVRSVLLPRKALLDNRIPLPPPSPLQQRLDWVSKALDLDPVDALALGLNVRLVLLPAFKSFARLADDGFFNVEIRRKLVGRLLGLTKHETRERFGNSGPLQRLGLLDSNRDATPSALLMRLLGQDTVDPAVLEQSLLGKQRQSQLDRSDFDHLGDAIGDVAAIVDGALTRRETGINLLFHGIPGTGKTELATLLGELCRAHVVFAGETNERDKEPDRADRLTHLSLLSALGQRVGRTVVVVDEADDIFVGVDADSGADRTGARVFMHRLLETNPIPTIWITNYPARLGEAVLRRMVRAVAFRTPGFPVRQRIVDRHAATQGLPLDAGIRDRLARLPVAPAIIASSLRAANLGSSGKEDQGGEMAIAAALSIHEAMNGRTISAPLPEATAFDPSLAFADMDLEAIEERIIAVGREAALSFLLTGLPGTGKSLFARHLAALLGMEVQYKRGSDILGMYLGQTEENIANTFREAIDNRTFLIFDEVDSLLADRRGAEHTWQVSQVNEFLSWLENHPYPIAATSNLVDRLDLAVQRRFLFKISFFAMTPVQIGVAFQRYFGCEAPTGVCQLDPLTPGDFVVVRNKAKILRITDAALLGEMLRAEVEAKSAVRDPKMGFE